MTEQDHELEKTLDMRRLLRIVKPAIDAKKRIVAKSAIKNIDRVVGTIIGSEISKNTVLKAYRKIRSIDIRGIGRTKFRRIHSERDDIDAGRRFERLYR